MTGEGGRSAAPEIRSTPIPWSATAGPLTEGPRWYAERGKPLWVDILGGTLQRGRPGLRPARSAASTGRHCS